MVDLHWKSKMPSSKTPKLSLSDNKSLPSLQLPFRTTDISPAAPSVCAAYDYYLRLPQLRKLWNSTDFPNWNNEPILKPILQALEITFRFLSIVLSDPRPYSNHREWTRRIESLITHQIEIIAILCEDEEQNSDTRGTAPTADLSSSNSSVSRSYSEASLLPHLSRTFQKAAEDCYAVERIWKLLAEVEDLHLMMDPDDFLRLKNQLSVKSSSGETASFCFRSNELVELTKMCRDLRHKVPEILEVEVDPKGGPRIQEAAMKLYVSKSAFEKVHLLQAMQAIEAAMKRFFYAYKQVLAVVMGSSEANGNRVGLSCDSADSLTQIFLEPTYFPSLDAAKTFLGYLWDNNDNNKWI
ncbi:Nematode resistance protein-like HSPRO1 [Glycine soja]|uniref:Nematode resistance protein-like HSPRO1 n=1 Tax=Glycine soja TaxID=3848 RepID=A0A0B2RX54_GLYSO|nr:Nematode resistance protein-like HSPRO1 [Glycine soja]